MHGLDISKKTPNSAKSSKLAQVIIIVIMAKMVIVQCPIEKHAKKICSLERGASEQKKGNIWMWLFPSAMVMCPKVYPQKGNSHAPGQIFKDHFWVSCFQTVQGTGYGPLNVQHKKYSIGRSFLRSLHSDVWELLKQDANFLTQADFFPR